MKLTTGAILALTPSAGMHLRRKSSGDIYEGTIYLGKYDSEDSFDEVSEDDYERWLKGLEEASKYGS